MIKNKFLLVCLVVSLIGLVGCTIVDPYDGRTVVSDTAIGTGVGALGGALVGQLIGKNTDSTLIGAGLGAAIGGVAGNYMDRQSMELGEQLRGTGVQIARVGNDIRLIMPGDITFDHDQANIKDDFYGVLNSIAKILKKFKNTTIKITGHTSSIGSAMYNQILSERRAHSVGNYLIAQGIVANRCMVVGYGARYPVAADNTSAGQAANRRVEITLHSISN